MELNTVNFGKYFPTDEACTAYLAKQRWPSGVVCVHCGSIDVYRLKRAHAYECKDCGKQFNPRTGTPFQNSAIPMRKWFLALHLLTSLKRGISSVQLGKELGVGQPTAWSMMHRLRAIMNLDTEPLEGIVAQDETFFGPRTHRRSTARYTKTVAVMGMVEVNKNQSRVRVKVTKYPDASVALPFIRANIKLGTKVYTDGSTIYSRLHREYYHRVVNHSKWQWADGEVTTNAIESFWSHLKRGVFGTYYQVTHRYLQRYADEFAFKHNTRWLSQWQRFDEWFVGLRRPRQIQAVEYIQLPLF